MPACINPGMIVYNHVVPVNASWRALIVNVCYSLHCKFNPEDIHWHGTTVKLRDVRLQLPFYKLMHPMDNRLHGTTVELRDALQKLRLNKYPRPMDIHWHGTTVEVTDALHKLRLNK
jgi:hypothetical protein